MRRNRFGCAGVLALAALVGCGGGGATTGTGGAGATGRGGAGAAGGVGGAGAAGGGKGEAGGAGGGFTSSVPSGTPLGGLTTSQGVQLCMDVTSYVNHALVSPLCDAIAAELGPKTAYDDLVNDPSLTDADLRAACLGGQPEAGACSHIDAGVMNSCDPSTFTAVPATCSATVGDYGDCLTAIGPDYDGYAGTAPTCATLTAASLRAYFGADGGGTLGPAAPAACAPFVTGGSCSGVAMPGTGTKK